MTVEEYVQPGENIYCRTKVTKGGGESTNTGDLVCTDTRLIFIGNSGFLEGSNIVDMDLESIEEIEYNEYPLPRKYLLGVVLSLLAAFVVSRGLVPLGPLPPRARPFVIIGTLAIAGGFLFDAYRLYRSTLIVRLSQNSHRFRGEKLGDFPHAIRGGP